MIVADAGLDLTGFHRKGERSVIQKAGEKSPTIFEDKSCVECGHIRVCTIHRFVSRFLEESFPNDEKGKSTKPLESKDLAQFCSLYFNSERSSWVLR